MKTIGLHVSRVVLEAFPRRPRDLTDGWCVVMPQLHDAMECVQIGTEFILSLGAHDTHANLLLSASHTASIQDVRQIENLITYVFDAPCLLTFPNRKKASAAYYKGLKTFFNFIGHRTRPDVYSLEHHLAEIWENAGNIVSDAYMRLLPRDTIRNPQQMCWTCDRPSDGKFNRAIAVYRQALISPEPQGMILNYWRALEALTTQQERYAIARHLTAHRLKPVRAFHPHPARGLATPFNLMTKYRRHALKYFSTLVATHGTADDVMDHLYKNRRNPSAHAGRNILDIAGDVTLLSLYEDALLLKFMCRCAIEKHWRTL